MASSALEDGTRAPARAPPSAPRASAGPRDASCGPSCLVPATRRGGAGRTGRTRWRGEHGEQLRRLFATYRDSLSDDRRLLLQRFAVHDFALKVVGVGSVGTRCFVALLVSDMGEPLFLQIKEADPSVLAPFWTTKPVKRQGRRVVTGQRVMQADRDIFLGWAEADDADFYVRQLRDMKASADFATMSRSVFRDYLRLCGWTLARAHARAGGAPPIAGYLGKGDSFDRAVTRFAVTYAEQTVRDHAALREAVARGQIAAQSA